MQPILIVGAGPVGLIMAVELARYGVPVRLIDRSLAATTTSKALVVWARTLELLDRAGCTAGFVDAGLKARGATIRTADAILGHADFTGIASAYNFALMLPQRDTERLLTEHLATLGVSVEREVELTGFVVHDDRVEAKLRYADSRSESVSTGWLIGCDGAHSAVRRGLGIDFHGTARGDDWLLADIRIESGSAAPQADELTIYLHRNGPLVVFPLPGGRARVIADVGKSDPGHAQAAPTITDVQALVDARTAGFRVADPVWLSYFRINERKVANYRRGRAFLVGDAAHIHSPAGGQGMNTGMQDAINLAWKLALALRNPAAERLLDSYSPERGAVGDLVLRNAGRLTDIATLANPVAQAARNLALSFLLGFHAVGDRITATMSEIEIAYPDSALSLGRGSGARLSPTDYAGPSPGNGTVPRFVLYASDTQRGTALAMQFPNLLEAAPRIPPAPDTLLIVRLDAYIGFSGHDKISWAEAENYLTSITALERGA